MHTFGFILTNLRVLHFKNIYSIQKKHMIIRFASKSIPCSCRPEVYISGVRGISTTQISAASSQRIEVTCDADACGAKVFRGTDDLAIRSRGYQRGGFYMGLSENRVYSQWNSHSIGIMIIIQVGLSENVGLIFPMIYSHLKTGLSDQQNHWV